jgi:hypothetical protein
MDVRHLVSAAKRLGVEDEVTKLEPEEATLKSTDLPARTPFST